MHLRYSPISASVALAKGHEIQSCSTVLEIARRISRVSKMVYMPSFKREEDGSSIRRANIWAVSLDIEAMDVVKGDEDSD